MNAPINAKAPSDRKLPSSVLLFFGVVVAALIGALAILSALPDSPFQEKRAIISITAFLAMISIGFIIVAHMAQLSKTPTWIIQDNLPDEPE